MAAVEFEDVYKAYFGPVYRYLLRLSGDEQLAEELAAETFFRALRAAEGFRGECEVRVWLCQIAKNAYYTHQKKSRRACPADEALLGQLADPAPPPGGGGRRPGPGGPPAGHRGRAARALPGGLPSAGFRGTALQGHRQSL